MRQTSYGRLKLRIKRLTHLVLFKEHILRPVFPSYNSREFLLCDYSGVFAQRCMPSLFLVQHLPYNLNIKISPLQECFIFHVCINFSIRIVFQTSYVYVLILYTKLTARKRSSCCLSFEIYSMNVYAGNLIAFYFSPYFAS
jgi:hypothetical protein